MKVNYQLLMEGIISNLNFKPKLLLHACCGVCSSSVIERLYPFFDITIFYYNPNTYPEEEYLKRLDTQREIVSKMGLDIDVLTVGYDNYMFDEISKGFENEDEGGKRCSRCYFLRLEKTALYALENGYDYFCTTLSVSPYKNVDKLNKIGKALEVKYGVKYLFSDFKKKDGYKRSCELARMYNLYRQDYCGCKYSLDKSLIL